MEQNLYLILTEGFRAFFLLIIPIFSGILIGSVAISFLQGFLGIRDYALSFCVRFAAFVLIGTFFFNSFFETLKRVFILAFQ